MHFFTNPIQLSKQTKDQCFGPIDNNNFRVCSRHKSINSNTYPQAIAVQDGQICIFETKKSITSRAITPTYNADQKKILTIVLKPDYQIPGLPPVKYFIYRGIVSGSIFMIDDNFDTDSENQIYRIGDTRSTDFTNFLQGSALPGTTINKSNVISAATEYQNNPIYLDEIFHTGSTFNKIVNGNTVTFPIIPLQVKAGMVLGEFLSSKGIEGNLGSNTFSFEIMLDSVGFNPKISEAIDGLNQTTNGTDTILFDSKVKSDTDSLVHPIHKRALKQSILNYIDPVAYFSSAFQFAENCLNVVSSIALLSPGSRSVADLDDFYGRVLHNSSSDAIFFNINRIYIDIRDRYNYSYNFFSEKDNTHLTNPDDTSIYPNNNIGISIESDPLKFFDFNKFFFDESNLANTSNMAWPILIFDLIKSGISYEESGYFATKTFKTINISFPLPEKFLDVQLNFNVPDQTDLIPLDPRTRSTPNIDQFFRLPENSIVSYPNYKKSFRINIANAQFIGVFFPVSTFVKIRHIEGLNQFVDVTCISESVQKNSINFPYVAPPIYYQNNYLDQVFPVQLDVKWRNFVNNTIVTTSNVYYDGYYLDNISANGRDFIANLGIAVERFAGGFVHFFAFDRAMNNGMGEEINNEFIPVTPRGGIIQSPFLTDIVNSSNDLLTNSTYNFTENGNVHTVDNIGVNSIINFDNKGNQILSTTNSLVDFVNFKLSQLEYSNLLALYETNFSQVNQYTQGLRAYIGLKLVRTGQDNTRQFNWGRFELILQGYRFENINGVQELVRKDISSGIIISKHINSLNLLNSKDVSLTPNDNYLNRGFSLTLDNFTQIPTQKIVSTIYLVRSPNLSYNEFASMALNIKENIQFVWNTTSNLGLTASIRQETDNSILGDLTVTNPISNLTSYWQQINPISADGVKILIANPLQLKSLMDNEVVITVLRYNKRSGIRRSSLIGRRQGSFTFEDSHSTNPIDIPVNVIDCNTKYRTKDNTFAHEFGHIMGLTDRYTTPLKMRDESVNVLDERNFNSSNYPLYLPESYDPEYSRDYRWMHNLMSSQTKVPFNSNTTIFNGSDPSPNNLITADYWNRMAPFLSNSNDESNFGNIFITPKQWQIIFQNGIRPIVASNMDVFEGDQPIFANQDAKYFYPGRYSPIDLPTQSPNADAENFWNPLSFVGIDSSGNVVSDNHFSPNINVALQHTMDRRIVQNAVLGYFNFHTGIDQTKSDIIKKASDLDPGALHLILINQNLSSTLLSLNCSTLDLVIKNLVTAPFIINLDQYIQKNVATCNWNYFDSPNVGNGDAFGVNVWNYLINNPVQVGCYTNVPTNLSNTPTYSFLNFFSIIKYPNGTSLPNPILLTRNVEYWNRLLMLISN